MGNTMKKALIITNTASMVHLFNSVNIGALQDEGYEVHIACNFINGNTASKEAIEEYKREWREKKIISHHIDFLRSPFSFKSFKIYRQTKELIKSEDFDIIHCHTPIVSAFTRIAASRLKVKAKIIYTAHGFHFYKGCPLFNWITYYPIEKFLAPKTDLLITMNKEDYAIAQKNLKASQIEFIDGVGINADVIYETPTDRDGIREILGIPKDQLIMISVGEVNCNKNHKVAIEALSLCRTKNIHYIVAGVGNCVDEHLTFARLCNVEDRVHFLGFRKDVYKILKASDIFIFPSYREGLSVALTEAMACELPIVASKIRGNIDLIDEEQGGFLCKPTNVKSMAKYIDTLAADADLRRRMGLYNYEKAKKYDKNIIICKLMSMILGRSNCSASENAEFESALKEASGI